MLICDTSLMILTGIFKDNFSPYGEKEKKCYFIIPLESLEINFLCV